MTTSINNYQPVFQADTSVWLVAKYYKVETVLYQIENKQWMFSIWVKGEPVYQSIRAGSRKETRANAIEAMKHFMVNTYPNQFHA